MAIVHGAYFQRQIGKQDKEFFTGSRTERSARVTHVLCISLLRLSSAAMVECNDRLFRWRIITFLYSATNNPSTWGFCQRAKRCIPDFAQMTGDGIPGRDK